jgi:hypothetical protein
MQTGGEGGPDKDMGPLPTASKVLIGTLIVTWILIGVYYVAMKRKSAKK